MGYDIRDIIDKALDVASKRKGLYSSLMDINPNVRVRFVINTLLIQVDKDIKLFNELKQSITDDIAEEIDFDIYDKISSLVYQFNRILIKPNIRTSDELLNFALDVEEKQYALFVDIQGRLVKDNVLVESQAYLMLNKIIEVREKNIKNIKYFIK
ncbi:MAG: hypothetical protein WBA54_15550 [Acidaminobacteraceae bacterium]